MGRPAGRINRGVGADGLPATLESRQAAVHWQMLSERDYACGARWGLGEAGHDWLRHWVTDGYFVEPDLFHAAVIDRFVAGAEA